MSSDPPIIALTFSPDVALPAGEFSVATELVRMRCVAAESKEIGDRVMLFAAVQNIEVHGGTPLVNWRRAVFHLRLAYPFLESAEELNNFVNRWRIGTLPKIAWTHAAHVAVTGYYAFDSNPDTVFAEMKRGILHFNTCTGVVNGPDSGYHETLTRFWSNAIAQAVNNSRPATRLDAAVRAVRIFGEDRDLPILFYSFNVARDRRARAAWVPPDLEPLPEWYAG